MVSCGWRRPIAASLLLAAALSVSHAQKTEVVLILGDGLSDTENTFIQTGLKADSQVPSPEAYWNGRFTNQPGNWVDYLDNNDTSTATRNFAYGGATACDYPERTEPPPGLDIPSIKTQAVKLLEKLNNQPGYKERLMGLSNRPISSLVWAGHGDLLAAGDMPAAQAAQLPGRIIDCLHNASKALLNTPELSKALVLGTLLPLDQTPAVAAAGKSVAMEDLVKAVNDGLKELQRTLQSEYPGSKIVLWDIHKSLEDTLKDSDKVGLPNLEPCVTGSQELDGFGVTDPTDVCTDAGTRVFFDGVYPTSAVHKLVAADLLSTLSAEGLLADGGGGGGGGVVPKPVVPSPSPADDYPSPSPSESPSPSPSPSPSYSPSPSPSPSKSPYPTSSPADYLVPSPDDHGGHGGGRDDHGGGHGGNGGGNGDNGNGNGNGNGDDHGQGRGRGRGRGRGGKDEEEDDGLSFQWLQDLINKLTGA